ncbi:heparan-alpha-glucosaminide N-acetyltransferase [Pseudotabrizicola sp. 4114]|uniref:heparan-alpha-glucosaminide N-acetyltransferase n=1 Tax=Pseudotabrizicola sp. 4114 TaxID=2817731 RepID=UPI00285DE8DC|nr:putative membrane protein [Pseudorhodobacter sp. 4114]
MTPQRIHAIDLARTLALLAMAGYHFTFDLMLFGHLSPGYVFQGPWPLIARAIASTFLFLAGVSLWLAHGHGIRWTAFWKRFAMVAGAAALVTIATYYTMGAQFIRWGILHAIAAGSLIGLAFLRAPVILTVAAAAAAFAAPHLGRSDLFNAPHWIWLGLSTEIPPMMDYEPLLPWLCPVLLGLATAKLMTRAGAWETLRRWQPGPVGRAALWPGKHSLAIYLIHQPVLFGAVYVFTRYL